MIDCATATDLLLEAEPAELRGEGETALAAHVRECASCRGQAELLLGAQARLAHALDTITALHTTPRSKHRPATRRWLPRVLLPVAAAAAAVIVVVSRPGQRADQPLPPLLVLPARVAEVPVVNASTDRNVAVMRTSDPKITVVWYY
jgi:hypothetical protein